MAVLSDIIRQVRRLVHDTGTPALYADAVYTDSINFGLQKLNYDFDNNPGWTITTIPSSREFLLIKIATIQMCYVRGGESMAAAGESILGDGPIKQITVPDLDVIEDTSIEANYWFQLARDIQDEYDGELAGRRASNAVVVGVVTRDYEFPWRSPTRSRIPPQVVQPPSHSIVVAGSLLQNSPLLVWNPWYETDFARYEIWNKTSTGVDRYDTNSTLHYEIVDNQQTRFHDTGIAPGTYYYVVYVVNLNGQYSLASNEISVVVP